MQNQIMPLTTRPAQEGQFFGSGLSDMFWSAILESLAAVLFFLFSHASLIGGIQDNLNVP